MGNDISTFDNTNNGSIEGAKIAADFVKNAISKDMISNVIEFGSGAISGIYEGGKDFTTLAFASECAQKKRMKVNLEKNLSDAEFDWINRESWATLLASKTLNDLKELMPEKDKVKYWLKLKNSYQSIDVKNPESIASFKNLAILPIENKIKDLELDEQEREIVALRATKYVKLAKDTWQAGKGMYKSYNWLKFKRFEWLLDSLKNWKEVEGPTELTTLIEDLEKSMKLESDKDFKRHIRIFNKNHSDLTGSSKEALKAKKYLAKFPSK
ncbi:MAG: hypothetical protein HRT58_14235 [Crocinitomicaceae bacterium]|nr:hypothetical protein [Flavobacteriales bacterium]NQZ36824.1 hypothetical protein [Crocinitomicaceae bacterium]